MSTYLLLKFAHIIAFVYWLGGDLGTFLASKQVVRRDLSPQARQVALHIMLACDQGPKLAMPLIFPLGLHMAYLTGLVSAPQWLLVAVWLASLYWFATVLVLYANEGKPFTARLGKIDFYFRIAVVAVLLAAGLTSLVDPQWISAPWLSFKILIFAAMVGCGIFIRLNLKPFIPAFVAMMSKGATVDSDAAMASSVQRCRPFVWAIWAGLFINAALGLHLI